MPPSPSSSNQFDPLNGARLPGIPTAQLRFQSASEYACAKLLEDHCGWAAHPGATFQVPIGRCFFDFRVGNCLVEYHPISLRNELLTELLTKLQTAIKPLHKNAKSALLEAVANELKAQYMKRRGQVASAHMTYKDCEVVCCFDPEHFIEAVIHRHAVGPIAATADLLLQFQKHQRDGKRVWRA